MSADSPWAYGLLCAVGIIAGGVDSVAGGGGLITLPVLLTLGFPAPIALGTNKLQASFGSTSATWHYRRAGWVKLRDCWVGILATAVGAFIGAICVQHLDPRLLRGLIPALLALVVIYLLANPVAGKIDRPARLHSLTLFVSGGLVLGFYDGFLGPGTGSFWTIALVTLGGMNLLKATGTTKAMNATSNLASLAWFLAAGSVDWRAGLAMGAGQLAGARLGTRLAVRGGFGFVRPVFLALVIVLIVRLLYGAIRGS